MSPAMVLFGLIVNNVVAVVRVVFLVVVRVPPNRLPKIYEKVSNRAVAAHAAPSRSGAWGCSAT